MKCTFAARSAFELVNFQSYIIVLPAEFLSLLKISEQARKRERERRKKKKKIMIMCGSDEKKKENFFFFFGSILCCGWFIKDRN